MKTRVLGALLVSVSILVFGLSVRALSPTQQKPQEGRSLMEEMYTRLLDLKSDIMGVRNDHAMLLARFTATSEMMRQQGNQIDTLQKTIEGLTIGSLAGPLTHDLDKRVTRIESYIDSDKNLKLEMSWWFRTLGAAGMMWLVGQIWARLKQFRMRHHDQRTEEQQITAIRTIAAQNSAAEQSSKRQDQDQP